MMKKLLRNGQVESVQQESRRYMLSYIFVNLIVLFMSISVTFILFKVTGDTIDRYDVPYFIVSVIMIYCLVIQFYDAFIRNMI